MVKWTNGVLSATLGLAAFGCSKPDGSSAADAALTGDAAAGPSMSAAEASLRKATIAVFLASPKAPLTPAIEEALLLDFDGHDTTAKAPSVQTADTSWKTGEGHPRAAGMAEDGPRVQALAAKHLNDPSAGVRSKSFDLFDPVSADDAGKKAFVEAVLHEPSPDVLWHTLHLVRGDMKTNADVRALVLKSADSPSADLRTAAVKMLLDPASGSLAGAFEKAAETLASDPDANVRYQACIHLYGTADARAIPLFDKYLNDAATPDALYRGCFVGLELAWLPTTLDEQKPSADAFRLTVATLEKTPRTSERPPSTIEHIGDAPVRVKPDESSNATAWRAAAKSFLDVPRLTKALDALLLDPAAGGDTRVAAAEDLVKLGESPAKLAGYKTSIVQMDKMDAGGPDDETVMRRLSALLAAKP